MSNIEARKLSLVQKLLMIQKESMLDKMEAIFKNEETSLSQVEKNAIDEGLQSLKENGGIAHKSVMEETKKRYPNLFK